VFFLINGECNLRDLFDVLHLLSQEVFSLLLGNFLLDLLADLLLNAGHFSVLGQQLQSNGETLFYICSFQYLD